MKATDPRISKSSPVHPFATVELFGLPFLDAQDEAAVADHLATTDVHQVSSGKLPILFTPNVDIVVQLAQNSIPGLASRLSEAAYVLPDGAPIVWTARRARRPLQARIAGSTVFAFLWPRLAADRRRVVVFCSSDAVRAGLEAEHPEADVQVAPMMDTSDEQIIPVAEELVARAIDAKAEFCILCVGHPKDSMIALAAIERWPADVPTPLMLCLGASAEFHLGIKRRAPGWAQRHGLEWLVRFAQEPRRMFARYFIRDVAFLPMMLREVSARRRT